MRYFVLRPHYCILRNILIEQAALALNKVAETVQEGDENSEPPSDFGSEPSSPPESDSEPESDPPEDDETPPESEFDDEPSTEPNSFMDESFIDSIIDDSVIEGSFIDDDDGTFYCLCIAFLKHTTRLNPDPYSLLSMGTDNLTLPSMSTGTMQRFMGGDGDDDGLLPDFESDDEFDDYIFGTLSLIYVYWPASLLSAFFVFSRRLVGARR